MLRYQENELIGEDGFGIPAKIFTTDYFSGSIVTGSGDTIYVKVSPRIIQLTENNVDFFSLAEGAGFHADVLKGILKFIVHTRPRADAPHEHPDFFASKLVDEVFAYLKRQKIALRAVKADWTGEREGWQGTNYQQFINALGNNCNPLLAEQIAAARQTWAARKFTQHGFGRISPKDFLWHRTPGEERLTIYFSPGK